MERLKAMKECLSSVVQSQMANLNQVDTHELGEAIDMVKDLEEAMYYCSIVKAMEESKREENHNHMYYPPVINEKMPNFYPDERMERDMDRNKGRMYYSGSISSNNNRNKEHEYEREFPVDMMNMRDSREGRSPQARRTYMESKEMHKDQAQKMKDLEKYMQDLGQDIVEMIEDASPEERKTLEKKISALATKVAQVNA